MSFPSIPGYEMLDQLGQGAMGTVYKAKQIALDRPVAIKVLRHELAEQTRYLERLQREAKLTARLDHPNVVKGIDYGVAEGRPYFVMEYAEGKSLKELLRERGRFREDDSIEIAMQIAGALENAHRHGVVHRDVKPGNIVLSSGGVAKLTDLGLARRPGDPTVTHTGATMGTPQYISPEQARNPSAVDVRSDIYSLGATLYHLVTGSPPFAGESLADLLTKVLFEQAEAASTREASVSQGFSLVLRKMLAKDPARRYQTPGELLDDLRRVRAHEAPAVEEKSLIESPSPKLRPAVVAGSLGIGALLLGIGWALRPGEAGKTPADSGSRARIDFGALRPDSTMSCLALLDRLDLIGRQDQEASLSSEERSQLDAFSLAAKNVLREKMRQATREQSESLLASAKEKRFLQIASFWGGGYRSFLPEHLGISAERLRGAAPELAAEWDRWREIEAGNFREKMKRLGDAFALAAQRHAAKVEPRVLDRIQSRQFRQAWRDLEDLADFRDEEGTSAGSLPWSLGNPGAELLDRFAAQMREKLAASSRDLAQKAIAEAGAAADSLEATLAIGSFRSVTERFDREIAKIFDRWKLRTEDLLAQDDLECGSAIAALRARLDLREESLRREAASRVLLDFDQEFSSPLRQRDYERIRKEWAELAERPSLDPVREEIEARLGELDALIKLRDRFAEAVQQSQGRTIEIREGSIRKTGKLVRGFDFRTGEFTLEPERGPVVATSFGKVHSETIGKLCATLDLKTGQPLADLPADRLYSWACFLFYEGSFSAARPLFERLSRQGYAGPAIQSALSRLDKQERELLAAQKERERQASEAIDAARRLGLVGEFARARDKYAQTLKDFAELDSIREKRAEIEAEMARLAVEEREMAKAESLRAQFPGAWVLPLDESRLVLRYSFRSAPGSDWKIPESWKLGEAGLRRKERCRGASEFKGAPGPQIALPLSIASGTRVSFRIAFPFEEGDPFYASFTVAGHSFGVWSGGEDALAQVASWVGNPDLYESHFKHPGAGAPAGDAPRFRFLRGGRYEAAVEILPGGREAVLRIDGQEIARSSFKAGAEIAANQRDRIEFRSWERVELREVTIEGVNWVGK